MGQCGNTEVHEEHQWHQGDLPLTCPGLDGTETDTCPPNPALTVACEDCRAPIGLPCRTGIDGATHGQRRRAADLAALDRGVCRLCGRFMVAGTVEGQPRDAWHPMPADQGCPDLPDPTQDWNKYAGMINRGLTPGHPGLEHFIPVPGIQPDDLAAAVTPAEVAACWCVKYPEDAALPASALPGHTPDCPNAQPPRHDCPECRGGKHQNCTFTIPVGDGPEVVPCSCAARSHKED